MTGNSHHRNVLPVTVDEIMFTRLNDSTRAHWVKVEKQSLYAARVLRRKAIDEWFRSCDVMLQFTCPGLYDKNGKPLK